MKKEALLVFSLLVVFALFISGCQIPVGSQGGWAPYEEDTSEITDIYEYRDSPEYMRYCADNPLDPQCPGYLLPELVVEAERDKPGYEFDVVQASDELKRGLGDEPSDISDFYTENTLSWEGAELAGDVGVLSDYSGTKKGKPLDVSGVNWKTFDKQDYLKKTRFIASKDANPYAKTGFTLAVFEDIERKGRGFMRIQKYNSKGDMVELIDFEKDGWVLDLNRDGIRLFTRTGADGDKSIDAVVFPMMTLEGESSYGLPNIKLDVFIPRENSGGEELYNQATQDYIQKVKELSDDKIVNPKSVKID